MHLMAGSYYSIAEVALPVAPPFMCILFLPRHFLVLNSVTEDKLLANKCRGVWLPVSQTS